MMEHRPARSTNPAIASSIAPNGRKDQNNPSRFVIPDHGSLDA